MQRNNKLLYKNLIYNISEGIKQALNKFDISDYQDDIDDNIDKHTIDSIVNQRKYIYNTNILWSDLNIYTLNDVVECIPKTGYPIGINVIDNKYVSLKYMSEETPEQGNIYLELFPFCENDASMDNMQYHNDIYTGKIVLFDSCIQQDDEGNIYYEFDKTNNNQYIRNNFKCFNGKKQTQLIINNIQGYIGYTISKCVYQFNPGETKKGDWYIPEIGELIQIYRLKSVIEYICNILKNKGYYDMFNSILAASYASSTFLNPEMIYYLDDREFYIRTRPMYYSYGVLVMYEL